MEARSRLLELDADLAGAIEDPARQRQAIRSVTATVLALDAGEILDVATFAETAPVGVLLLDGFLVREMHASGRICAELLGPDDLVRPADLLQHCSPLPCTVHWIAATPVRLALLDHGFLHRTTPWPEIAAAMIERAGRPGRRLACAHGIATLPSVDLRVLASLWDWGSHWGYVASAGVRLELPLSHARIGHLIGAQRPTVTAALGRLRRQGMVDQPATGVWILAAPAGEPANARGEGVQMPLMDGMDALSTGRGRRRGAAGTARIRRTAVTADRADPPAVDALLRRLAEQRQTLSIASARHERMLARLTRESNQLRASSVALGRLARRRDPESAAGASAAPEGALPDMGS